MLSKNKQKYIRSLSQKKYRDEENAFIAEGPKLVEELMAHFQCVLLVKTPDYKESFRLQTGTEVIVVLRCPLFCRDVSARADSQCVTDTAGYPAHHDCAR